MLRRCTCDETWEVGVKMERATSASAGPSTTISASQFASAGRGHAFKLRAPLAKVGASRCAECGGDVFEHSRDEVSEADVLSIINVTAESSGSVIFEGELLVGGFRAAIAEAKRDESLRVANCAGHLLHDFLPKTKEPFDALRRSGRLLDLEWKDDESFVLEPDEVVRAVRWIQRAVAAGHPVLINCAQGKSRSGSLATAYVMATRDVGVQEALAAVQARRPFVQPNPGFMRQLGQMEAELRALGPVRVTS